MENSEEEKKKRVSAKEQSEMAYIWPPLVPNVTTSFTSAHTRALGIRYDKAASLNDIVDEESVKLPTPLYDQDLLIKGINRNELRVLDDEAKEVLESLSLNNMQRSLADYVNKVLAHCPWHVLPALNTTHHEPMGGSSTTNFLAYLLDKLELNTHPLTLSIQPRYVFELPEPSYTNKKSSPSLSGSFNQRVVSRPAFSVESANQVRLVLIDEGKNLTSMKLSNEFGECPLAGDLLAAACCNYSTPASASMLADQLVYGVRVIGTRFTFYRVTFSKRYIRSILADEEAAGEPASLEIVRFPSGVPGTSELLGLDFARGLDRRVILEMLVRLREHIKQRQ